ncbi:hypothetical protein LJB93_03055, partial [Desulfovibrio sp. OttesenSCG-928-F07]|nr:hypothetical protein [Desulfovibrio sp. OttesenSCG-928-F07]
MSIKDYSTTADENTQINGINIAENCPPSGINNAIRQLMADVAEDVTPVANPVGGLNENVFLGSAQPIENEPFKPAWKKLEDLADGSSILFENGKFSSAIPGF